MYAIRKQPITRQDIMKFSFPYKLWLVVHLECCDFIHWNYDGTALLLNLRGLDEYLKSTRSIFRIKTSLGFLQRLQDYKFEPVNGASETDDKALLQFKNDNFRMHHKELLCRITPNVDTVLGVMGKSMPTPAEKLASDAKEIYNYSSVVPLEDAEPSRAMHAKITLEFNNAKRLLKRQRAAVADGSLAAIEIPEELYENPYNSVMEDSHPEFGGGYYGNLRKKQLIDFYGDLRPKCCSKNRSSPPDTSGIVVVSSANLNDLSVLEPMIKLDVIEQDNEESHTFHELIQTVVLNDFAIKEEISMEVSVKVEDLSKTTSQTTEESFAQMQAAVKEEPTENEAGQYDEETKTSTEQNDQDTNNTNEEEYVEFNNFAIKEEISTEASVKIEELSETASQIADESFVQMLARNSIENKTDFY